MPNGSGLAACPGAPTSRAVPLAPERLGTHPESARRDPRHGAARVPACGRPGAPRHARARAPRRDRAGSSCFRQRGVTVSCGHTDATPDEANAAFDLRSAHRTHLFNAMRPFTHRDPGIAGVALSRGDVIVQVILDGIHLAPDTAKLIWSVGWRPCRARHGLDGRRRQRRRLVQPRRCWRWRSGTEWLAAPDGVLAGSSLTMIEAVRNLHSPRRPLADALDAATAVPSRIIGLLRGGPRRRCSRGRRRPRRQPRGRPRAGRRRAQWRCLSQAPPSLCRASCSAAEIREQPAAHSPASFEQRRLYATVGRKLAKLQPSVVRLVGHGSSDNAAAYGVYAFGLLPGWTAMRDSIVAHDLLRRAGSTSSGRQSSPSRNGPDARRRRVRRPGEEARGPHDRAHERPVVGARRRGRSRAAAGGQARSMPLRRRRPTSTSWPRWRCWPAAPRVGATESCRGSGESPTR